jgi:hypothetical protein
VRNGGGAGGSAVEAYDRARRVVRRRRAEVMLWLVVAVSLLGTALRTGHGRWWIAGAAVAAVLLAAARRPPADPERWLRGAAGEVATAALLDGLSARRWAVLHDRRLPGSRANVDHLLIGRRGVWLVDSKAYRAPVVAGWRKVRVGGHPISLSAVVWEASVVAERLGVEVRPVVVVHGVTEHGGHLPRRGRRCEGVRVLPADGLVRHLRRARTGTRLGRRVAELAARAEAVLPAA